MDSQVIDPPVAAIDSPSPVIITEKPPAEASFTPATPQAPPAQLSKNALKRMRKQQEWEDGADDRRKKRRDKRHERQSRKREAKASLAAQGLDPSVLNKPQRLFPSSTVPLTLIVDCGFEDYMSSKELISLSSQVSRCYAENKNARLKSLMYISGFAGKMADRFANVLEDVQKNWKGVRCVEEGWIEVATGEARSRMGGHTVKMCESLQRTLELKASPHPADAAAAVTKDGDVGDEEGDSGSADPTPSVEPEPKPAEGLEDIIYLTSDSPYTLERLEPHTSYIIGGIVDKNRQKGLCYRRARAAGVRTAKLPIGEFLQMATRPVLATNHVVDIMLKWLECEDWAEAFMKVIPRRKGGVLRGVAAASQGGVSEEEAEAEAEADIRTVVEVNSRDADKEEAEAPQDTSFVKAPAMKQEPHD